MFLLSVCALFLHLTALNPKIPVDRYVFKMWQLEDGLPQNVVTCITQTRDGYLWVGTGNGLARFDGWRFTSYIEMKTGEKIHDISVLSEDRRGNLWIASSPDLIRCRNGAFTFFTPDLPIGESHIFDIFEDRSGKVWFLTSKGLLRFYGTQFRQVSKSFVPRRHLETAAGTLLISTDKGIQRMKSDTSADFTSFASLGFSYLQNWFDNKGDLVFITDRGIRTYRLEAGRFQLLEADETLAAKDPPRHYLFDRLDRNWYASSQRLLIHTSPGTGWRQVWQCQPNETIERILADRDGNLWVGTTWRLLRINPDLSVEKFPLPEIGSLVQCLCEDNRGNLWIGLKRGLVCLRNPRVEAIPETVDGLTFRYPRRIFRDLNGTIHVTSDESNKITYKSGKFRSGINTLSGFLAQDKEGLYWTTSESHLIRFAETLEKPSTEIPLPLSASLEGLVQEEDGTIWAGTRYGLVRYRRGEVRIFSTQDGLSGDNIRDLRIESRGILWIGTASGVTIHAGGRFTIPFSDQTLARSGVVDIFEDKAGTIWLGAYGGLFRCRGETLFQFSTAHGLLDRDILSVQEDESGFLWLNTNHGIMRVAKTELEAVAAGQAEKLYPLLFDQSDGLKNIEGNASADSSIVDDRGRIWFCTMGGLVVIDPKAVRIDDRPPPVFIDRVEADGSELTGTDLQIGPGLGRLRLRFTAIDFAASHKVRFRHQLEGFDRREIEVPPGRERFVDYTNLKPGRYRFHVSACNGDGVWNTTGDSLELNILPFFWQTTWFRIAAALAGLAVLYLLYLFLRRFFFLFTYWRKKRLIGPYVLEEVIGHGAMATVFRARRLLSQKEKVAVKILKKEHFSDPLTLQRFKREGALIDLLDHPHIVRVLSRGEHEGSFYTVMEHLEGITLAERIARWGRFELPDAIPILHQLTDVLGELHRRSIVHRDLKPANIMLLDREGRFDFVKLLDFGTAKPTFQPTETESGTFVGTLAYMAPEQIHGQETAKSDLYSLGMIAYEMLAGIRPFAACKPFDLPETIQEHPPDPLGGIRPDLPAGLVGLIMRMLAKDPGLRPDIQAIRKTTRTEP